MESLSLDRKRRVLHILDQVEKAVLTLEERTQCIKSADDFLLTSSGMEKLDAACMLLIAIGESFKNIDKITDKKLLMTYPIIPWKDVMGLRDIVAHHYFHIDAEQIFYTIKNELPLLLEAILFFKKEVLSNADSKEWKMSNE